MTAELIDFDVWSALAEYCRTRDMALRNELVEHYLYLARSVARRFSGRGVDYDDLLQVASMALIHALERYDCSRGLQFITFAAPTLAGEVQRYFRDKARLVRLPRGGFERLYKLRQARESMLAELGREPSVAEIADRLLISEEAVLDLLEMRGSSLVFSLDARPGEEVESADALALSETIGGNDPAIERVESRDVVERALNSLPTREKAVLEMRVVGGRSQREVAREIGASQMSVSRMERRILEKLRQDIKTGD